MFSWPSATLVDRVVPKTKLLENARLTGRFKSLLTGQVREIRWLAKLAPETLRLSATPQVAEIEVFRLALKGGDIDEALLEVLDHAMAPPVLFVLQRPDGKEAYSAAFKRPSEADASEWVVARRYRTAFSVPAADPPPLPAAIDLGHLYAAILAPLLPLAARPGELTPAWMDRCDRFATLSRKLKQANARLHREKQFNRKVELNREVNELQAQLDALASL